MTNINRRSLLAGVGTLSLSTLAGCSATEYFQDAPEEANLSDYRTATVELAPNPDIHSATEIILSSDLTNSSDDEETSIPVDQQIRVQKGTQNENWRTDPFFFTAKTNSSYSQEQTQTVWLSNRGFDRVDIEPGDMVTLRPFTTSGQFDSRDQAESQNDILEQSFGNGNQTIFLAPHGGKMYTNTGRQAFVGTSEGDFSSWSLYGYGDTSTEARRRWQIPTDEVIQNSYLGFSQLNSSFEEVCTFLGMGQEDHDADIIVGGLAPMSDRKAVASAIEEVFSGEEGLDNSISVVIESTGDFVEDDPAQITNRLSSGNRGGISITQTPEVRREYWYEVAQAVTSEFDSY